MRKRNHIIPLHLNKKELTHLEAQVKLSGLAREEFLRSLIMGAQLQTRPCTHHADLLHKVAGLCNNANQLAKVANTYGEASQQSVEEKRGGNDQHRPCGLEGSEGELVNGVHQHYPRAPPGQ